MARPSKWNEECSHKNIYIPTRLLNIAAVNEWDLNALLVEAIVSRMGSGSSESEDILRSQLKQLELVENQISILGLQHKDEIAKLASRAEDIRKKVTDIQKRIEAKSRAETSIGQLVAGLAAKNYDRDDGGVEIDDKDVG